MTVATEEQLPVTALRAVRHVVSHDACADGLASAMLARDALPGVRVSLLAYGTAAHAAVEPTPGMLFCDFSPPSARLADFAEAGAIVLDHHRTSEALVRAMGKLGVYADEAAEPGVSGAVLVYRHVWRPLRGRAAGQHEPFVRRFADLAGVYDTWQRTDSRWRDARVQAKVLSLLSAKWWLARSLEQIADEWDTRFAWIGDALVDAEDEAVQRAADDAHRFITSRGTRVAVLADATHVSAAADTLASSADVIVAFRYFTDEGRAKLQVDLRSRGSFDCSVLARSRGGGGHVHAAGFTRAVEQQDANPFGAIETWFDGW